MLVLKCRILQSTLKCILKMCVFSLRVWITLNNMIVIRWKQKRGLRYAFDNICKGWVLKKYFIDTLVILVHLYQCWGIEWLSMFFNRKIQMSYMLLHLETESFPIEIMGIQRVVDYTLGLGYEKKNLKSTS